MDYTLSPPSHGTVSQILVLMAIIKVCADVIVQFYDFVYPRNVLVQTILFLTINFLNKLIALNHPLNQWLQ